MDGLPAFGVLIALSEPDINVSDKKAVIGLRSERKII